MTAPLSDNDSYELLDSGGGRLLEKVGNILSARPCPPAWWKRKLPGAEWRPAVDLKKELKGPLTLNLGTLRVLLSPQSGGLRGLAPELRPHWERVAKVCADFAESQRRPARVLNLYGGNGCLTLAVAQVGAAVTHVDASGEAVTRAQANAQLNPMPGRSIRWLVDDPLAFAKRERSQSTRYDLILLDPQTMRDGKRGLDLERDLSGLLNTVSGLLSDKPLGVYLFCRQGHVSGTTLDNLMKQEFSVFGGSTEQGEILLRGAEGVSPVPAGTYACWWKSAPKTVSLI